MANFPNSVWSPTTKSAGQTIDASHINDMQAEVVAIEDGYRNATAPLNSSKSTLATLSVLGNSTLASSITIGSLSYIFPASGGSSGQALVINSTNGSTLTLAWQSAGSMVLLKASSGNETSTAATNEDTISLTGLTVFDQLLVNAVIMSGSSGTNEWMLYHNTDSAKIGTLTNNANMSANNLALSRTTVMNTPLASTNIVSLCETFGVNAAGSTGLIASSIATAWTSPWTLALRHVASNGGAKWKWCVYKLVGQ